jgi:hypothetical protein
MRWITRENVKVDRVACPWLIRRFVDLDAVFVFLPKETDWKAVHDGAYCSMFRIVSWDITVKACRLIPS